jgi:hypothetical protein
MLVWLKGAPKFDPEDPESNKMCAEFIDEFITCENDDELAKYQRHRHCRTCKTPIFDAPGKYKCRFNIPYPPMPATEILTPHPKTFPEEKKKEACKNLVKIKEALQQYEKKKMGPISFDDFIDGLGLDLESYKDAVKCSIKKPTIFLVRRPNAAFINGYNKVLAEEWGANIDVQMVNQTLKSV